MKIPRDYQNWTHNATWEYIHNPLNHSPNNGKERPNNPLIVQATGLGKSMNIAMLIWHLSVTYPGVRIMQLAHVQELVGGNYEELMGMWPQAPAGVYASGLKLRDTTSDIVFAMINSVAKRAASFGKVDFLLIDEVHRLSDKDKSMYGQFIAELRKINPNMIVVGYTATPFRMGTGMIIDGDMFDEVVYDIGSGESFVWAVQNGYLIMPVPTDPGFQVDDSGVGISSGEFKTSEASAALHDQGIIEQAVDYSIAIAKEENRRSAIAFCQSIDDADLIADMLTMKGYPTEAVHSRMKGDREEILKAHKNGGLWGITNKDILTTGWNNPRVELFIGLRLTRSPGLWVQMIGRMTRPNWVNHIGHNGGPPLHDINTLAGRLASIQESGKLTARVLDFCGNTDRLGAINYPNIPKRRGAGGGDQPMRLCDGVPTSDKHDEGMGCQPATYHHVSVKVCPHCGYEWPVSSNVGAKASGSKLVIEVDPKNPLGLPEIEKVEKVFEVFGVHELICTHHTGKNDKEGNKKLDTLKASYRCGNRVFPVWVGIEHDRKKFYGGKAVDWWVDHSGTKPIPDEVQEAVDRAGELKLPKFVKVWTNTKFPEIVAYDFVGTKFEKSSEIGVPPTIHEPEPDPVEEERAKAAEAESWRGEMYYDDEIPF